MTIAIKRADGGIIFFDAVLEYGEKYSSSTTKHPISTGASITDHVIQNNPTFVLRGIVSDADFNVDRPNISNQKAKLSGISKKQFTNSTETESSVVIKTSPARSKFLPEAFAQFVSTQIPTVDVPTQSKAKFAERVKSELIDMQSKAEVFSIVDFRDNTVWDEVFDCVMVSLDFIENADTGTAIFPVMQIEQVRFTDTRKVKIAIQGTVANKGRKSGDIDQKESEEGDDASDEKTKLSSQDSSQLLKLKAKLVGG